MTALSRFWAILAAPNRVFDDIREGRVGWKQPWLLVSIPYMLVTYLSLPIQRVLVELNDKNLTPDQLDKQLEIMDKLSFLWVLMAPLGVLAVTLVLAGVSYLVVTMMSERATFKQYLSLSLFTGIIGIIGQFIAIVMLRLRGIDQIMTADDARISFSLRVFAPAGSPVLKGFLGSFEFFTLWGFVVLVLGLSRVFGLRRGQAIAVLVPIWIIYVGMLVAGEVFGGMGQ
ncbi:MAG TPA: YIP1 family protein [Candidatus Krumholzibacteria bacterium]|nr:YIP1 family protein [Candidatus Krumholzibacteria bacterium]